MWIYSGVLRLVLLKDWKCLLRDFTIYREVEVINNENADYRYRLYCVYFR